MATMAEMGYRLITLLPPTTIGAAVALTTTAPIASLVGMNKLLLQSTFVHGAGGTTVNVWVQTSIDKGVSWFDIAQFRWTTADGKLIHTVTGSGAANYVPTDGTLDPNTVKDGVLGDRLRCKYVTSGVYTGVTTIAVYAITRGA